jgi:hypothetical protein
MDDDVPSRGNLLPVQSRKLAQTPPDSIAHNRTAKGFLDAEAKPALRQIVRFYKSCEVGTRASLAGAIDGIKLRLRCQPRFARILQPGFTRA